MRVPSLGRGRSLPPLNSRNGIRSSTVKVIRQEGVAAGVGGLGNVLIGKVLVVVSSRQQSRNTVPTLPMPSIRVDYEGLGVRWHQNPHAAHDSNEV